nr:Transposon Tf2-2 polyprotein [Ipomoea batatas]
MKGQTDKGRRDIQFQIGELVMLKLTPQIWKKISSKTVHWSLVPKYDGPFEVMHKVGDVPYRLRLPDRLKIHPTFHVSFLKKFNQEEFDAARQQVKCTPPLVRDRFEKCVAKILDHRIKGQQLILITHVLASRAIQLALPGKNCNFNSFLSRSHDSILSRPALASTVTRELHHTFASPAKYMLVIATFSPSGTLATRKYSSISHRKFSNSFALRAPLKGLGSGILNPALRLDITLCSPAIAFFIKCMHMDLELLNSSPQLLNIPINITGYGTSLLMHHQVFYFFTGITNSATSGLSAVHRLNGKVAMHMSHQSNLAMIPHDMGKISACLVEFDLHGLPNSQSSQPTLTLVYLG